MIILWNLDTLKIIKCLIATISFKPSALHLVHYPFSYSKVISASIPSDDLGDLLIYPNPTTSRISFSSEKSDITDLKLFNSSNLDITSSIKIINISDSKLELHLEALPPGNYFYFLNNYFTYALLIQYNCLGFGCC